MKRIIICILILIMVFSSSVSAEMDFSLSADADKIVSTEIEINPGELVKVIVLKENANINNINEESDLYYFAVLETGSETSNVSAEINMDGAAIKQRYTVLPLLASDSAEDIDIGGAQQIGYDTLSNRLSCVNDIKTAIYNDEDGTDVKALLEGNAEFLGINLNLYDSASKEKVAEILVKEKARVTFDGTNGDLKKMVNFIDETMLVDVLNGDNADKVSFEYLNRVIAEKEDYASVKALYEGIEDDYKANVLNFLKKKDCKTYADLKQRIINSIVINAFNYTDTNSENLYNILVNYKDITSPKLNMSKLDSFGYADKMTVTQNLSDKKLATIDELNTSLSGDLNGETTQNAPSGGGPGGGSGGGPGGGSEQAIETPTKSEGVKPFTDVEGYEWASDALYYLSHKNIVSGYENGEFRPQNNITRAEFVKIVVSCFFENAVDGQLPFADVSEDMWYASYIKTAFANGLVSGVSATQFAPNALMTRQDMAVVLYNAAWEIDFDMDTTKAAIVDDDAVADYAKEAVYALKNAGVINGYEDGTFKPSNYANRAETVQMIYNFIIQKEEYSNEN